MRCRVVFLPLLLLFSGCSTVPETPGTDSEELRAVEARYGKAARERVQSWRQLIDANKPQAVPEKLAKTNEFFNRLVFESAIPDA